MNANQVFCRLDLFCFLISEQLYHSYHTGISCHLNDGVNDEKGLGRDPGGEGGDQPGHPGRQVDQEGEGRHAFTAVSLSDVSHLGIKIAVRHLEVVEFTNVPEPLCCLIPVECSGSEVKR